MLRSRRRRRLRKDASRWKKENNPRKDIQRWSIKVYVCSIHFFLSSSSSSSASSSIISMRRCCCNFVARLTQLILCLSPFSSPPPSHSNLLYFEVGLKSKPKMELTTLHMNLPSSLARDVSSMKFWCLFWCFARGHVECDDKQEEEQKLLFSSSDRISQRSKSSSLPLSLVFVYGTKWISSKKSAHSPDR